ncbi:sigma factor-like helix-turn-helix DNA-binding protein [Sorangium sp. So ce1000]|uniref:RNA polymerase sigma factor n=1 Tax=Sorangium sp. So ce1000 TaxID=3133325 RepID=UPI003F641334
MTIARRLFIEHLRSARRERLDAPDTLDGAAVAPDEELDARRMADAVEHVLRGLPARQVEAFRLVREEGRSLDEGAARRGCTEMAARLCAHRARASVRRHLGEAWGYCRALSLMPQPIAPSMVLDGEGFRPKRLAIKLRARGLSIRKAAEKLGVSASVLHRALRAIEEAVPKASLEAG